jgi:SAM-dependent methyltransferase
MMRREATWIAAQLRDLNTQGASIGPVLSIGSGSAPYRQRRQPWIDREIYDVLAADGVEVIHHEMAALPGVDVVGDLTDDDFLASLSRLEIKTALCCNVFEHLADRQPLARALGRLLPPGGHAIVTVPRCFPYHADPIDTMFRPDVEELASELTADDAFDLVGGSVVACESLLGYWWAAPAKTDRVRGLARRVPSIARRGATTSETRVASPVLDVRPERRDTPSDIATMFVRRTEVTGVVIRKR